MNRYVRTRTFKRLPGGTHTCRQTGSSVYSLLCLILVRNRKTHPGMCNRLTHPSAESTQRPCPGSHLVSVGQVQSHLFPPGSWQAQNPLIRKPQLGTQEVLCACLSFSTLLPVLLPVPLLLGLKGLFPQFYQTNSCRTGEGLFRASSGELEGAEGCRVSSGRIGAFPA